MTENSYYDQRMHKLGITPENNKISLTKYDSDSGQNVLKEEPVFRPHEKGIEIIVCDLDRTQPTYTKEGSRWKKNWSIIRLQNPIVKPNGDTIKYLMPKGQGSYPFFPPNLIDKFDKKEKIKTLFLTEGYFKAFKGSIHGVDIVGVPSITHLKNKETGALHPEIIKLFHTCQVERMVWLTDGDCLDVSGKALDGKEEIDLYKRPSSFYASISTFKQLLDDFDVEKYFMHVDSDAILQESKFFENSTDKITREDVKGLDDIMISFPGRVNEIVEDLKSVSKSGFWFYRVNITVGLSKVREHFRLNNVNTFYLFHAERNTSLRNKEFVFIGTKYKYNDTKGECDIIIPGDAKMYFRVGDDYYEWLHMPNQYQNLEKVFHGRQKTTISDDHGRPFIKHIPKYKAFCNVPNHINYQQVIHNCFNVYSELDFQQSDQPATAEDCQTILKYLHHLFGEKTASYINADSKKKLEYQTTDLALDYLQIMYQQPWRKLPILCLVSKENNTGKSTFANFLRHMLGANVAIVGNTDISGDFNAHWATKCAVICDETKIDKVHVVEKIKSLSTAKKIWINAKGKGHIELDCFIKFILITNNEENFISAGEDDIRYWVIKVPVLTKENPGILDLFIDEMPAFLSFLGNRKLSTENRNRMWFHPDLLKTDALKKVIQYSRPTIQKEIIYNIREKFFDFGVDEIPMTCNAIRKDFFNNKYEANYVHSTLKNDMRIDQHHILDESVPDLFGNPLKIYKTCRSTYPRWEMVSREIGKPAEPMRVDVQENGRPYIFKRQDFLTPEEIAGIRPTKEMEAMNELHKMPGQLAAHSENEPPEELPW